MVLKDIQHALRVAYILTGAAAAALIVRAWLTPPTFGLYGAYRGASVQELMETPLKYHGVENCRSCHEEEWNEWRQSAHKSVACESCHGPGMEHSQRDVNPRPKIYGEKDLMAGSLDLCLSCHEKTPGRRRDFPQVEFGSHPALFTITEKDAGNRRLRTTGASAVSLAEPKAKEQDDATAQALGDKPLPWEYSCTFCHADPEIMQGDKKHLYIIEDDFAEDVHWQKGLRCHDCHGSNPVLGDFTLHEKDRNFRTIKSPADAPEFCGRCHFDVDYMRSYISSPRLEELTEYLINRHGQLRGKGGGAKFAACASCHGSHGIRSRDDLGSPGACVRCHSGHTPARFKRPFEAPGD